MEGQQQWMVSGQSCRQIPLSPEGDGGRRLQEVLDAAVSCLCSVLRARRGCMRICLPRYPCFKIDVEFDVYYTKQDSFPKTVRRTE